MNLITAPTAAEVRNNLTRIDLSDFAPFTLASLEAGSPATLFDWTRHELVVMANADRYMPLVSSSVDPEGADRERRAEFARLQAQSGGSATRHALGIPS